MVATDVYSHRQVLDDTVCFLVEPEPAAMARGMLEALHDEARSATVVAAARNLYESDYPAEACEEKMRRLLSGLGSADTVKTG